MTGKAGRSMQSPEQADAGGDRSGRWGRFIGHVVAEWLADGRDMRLVEPFAYLDAVACRWDAPAASVVNGASIPRAFWSVIGGPFVGRFRNASVVHDVACVARVRPWRQVHRMFYEACRCAETPLVQAKTMYYAVYHFGPRWQPEGRGVRDQTPRPPTPDEVAAIVAAFKARDVPEEAIPNLPPGMLLSGEHP
jgi:hypothetical protein